MNSYEIRLFIVSGNRLLREVLARLFKARVRISVSTAEHLTPETAEQMVSANADVLLLDTPSPIFEHAEHVRQMRADLPALKIVLMAMEDNDRLFLEAVKARCDRICSARRRGIGCRRSCPGRRAERGRLSATVFARALRFRGATFCDRRGGARRIAVPADAARAATRPFDRPRPDEQRNRGAFQSFRADHKKPHSSDVQQGWRGRAAQHSRSLRDSADVSVERGGACGAKN